MLNYIWLALIVIGVLVAVGNDWRDLSSDAYHNGEETAVTLVLDPAQAASVRAGQTFPATLELPGSPPVVQPVRLVAGGDGAAAATFTPVPGAPAHWGAAAKALRKESLNAMLRWEGALGPERTAARLVVDPVKFVRLNAVTNDGFLRYAKTAVELAIGLVGIMALWLGVMKIAEASGLVAKLAAVMRPVTTRLFPDVPADHPAMGAMVMNISANMLGLSNAATPLGLKAMEELNKLSKKAGTATDAMCTFLVINTSSVQLIPATVIALRAAAGSSNPTEILGPVIVATTVNTTVGIVVVKLLSKLPYFRRQLAPEAEGGAR